MHAHVPRVVRRCVGRDQKRMPTVPSYYSDPFHLKIPIKIKNRVKKKFIGFYAEMYHASLRLLNRDTDTELSLARAREPRLINVAVLSIVSPG